MSQRMILTAQANGRYPNFGGFCFGWDTTGYAVGGRKGLMTYWGWGDKTRRCATTSSGSTSSNMDEFTRRTGLAPVAESEYIAYLLSIGRPEFAPAIDLPTKLWLEEIARHTPPMPAAERAGIRTAAGCLVGLPDGPVPRSLRPTFAENLRAVDPALRNTASVQIDHAAVPQRPVLPVGLRTARPAVPDDLERPGRRAGLRLSMAAHGGPAGHAPGRQADVAEQRDGRGARPRRLPGKFTRVAAHGLPSGRVGHRIRPGRLQQHPGRDERQDTTVGETAGQRRRGGRAGRPRVPRPVRRPGGGGRGDHGVGILFSKSQYQRQHVVQGFGTAALQGVRRADAAGLHAAVRDGRRARRRPRRDVRALVVIGQTFPLPAEVHGRARAFTEPAAGCCCDGGTTIDVPRAEKLRTDASRSRCPASRKLDRAEHGRRRERCAALCPLASRTGGGVHQGAGRHGAGRVPAGTGRGHQVSLLQIDGGRTRSTSWP